MSTVSQLVEGEKRGCQGMDVAVRSDYFIMVGLIRLSSELPVWNVCKWNIEGRLIRGDFGKVSRTRRPQEGWARLRRRSLRSTVCHR